MKILLLDVETAPNTAHVWSLWGQNVSLAQLISSSYILCWSAKWLGSKQAEYMDCNSNKHSLMIRRIHTLLSEADAVLHYNGKRFDIPVLNSAFLQLGLPPAKPFKQIDLYQVVKRNFRLPSNKLEYVARMLGLKGKVKHTGHDLWVRCMAGDKAAWRMMQRYNKQDTQLLEQVYNKLLPWLHGVNLSTLSNSMCCPTCGTQNYKEKGFYYTESRKYTLYNCNKCYTWFRHRQSERLNQSRHTRVQL